jgi:membrane protein implicated in regulation of membrane protease activity
MADKEKEKEEIEIGVIVILFIIALALVPAIYHTVSGYVGPYYAAYQPVIISIAQHIFGILIGISIPVSLLLLIGIVAAVEGTKHVRKKEEEHYDVKVEAAYEPDIKGDPGMAKKWASAVAHVDSPNNSDWRQAIIEADIILGDLLTRMSFQGSSIGEQLTGATKGDFKTLDQAWEAHKVRNQIAHEGSDFALTQHEAKRVINLYRQVFEEFFYI